MATKLNLRLERKDQADETGSVGPVMFTPPIGADYWLYRVCVAEGQAVIGFPKFGLIGVGFAVEDDWNANLPLGVEPRDIADHIMHNAGSDTITRDDVIAAIKLIEAAAIEDGRHKSGPRRRSGARS